MQPTKKKTVTVKDKLDGNRIDLSLLELTDVPVKELAAVSRGTVLDLSNNQLITLSPAFPSLIHLVELDLSKNRLKELPVNFGDLKNLRHLDLYSNELERLPVSFHQLKELRWLDLKNNPLVKTLAEAAGDCLNQKECQDAAKKVVRLMTMVHAELEKTKLKEQEELKAQKLANKEEEDRARDRARQEKKAEKDNKRRVEAPKQAPVTKPEGNKTKNETKKEKKAQRQRQQQMNPNVQGQSCCVKLFVVLLRMIILLLLLATVVFALNWQGPPTMANAGKVAQRSVDQVVDYSRQLCDWASPHLKPIKEQWKQLSHFVAENGRNLVFIVWDKTVHYAQVVQRQALVIWPVVKQRTAEMTGSTGDAIGHYWKIVCRETPIYYEAMVNKLTQLYNGIVAGKQA